MNPKRYTSIFNKECEIWFRTKRDIPDMESYLYRFQVYIEDNVFGYDFSITNESIKIYELVEEDIIDICFDMACKILDTPREEYCSVDISKRDIWDYLKNRDGENKK